MSTDEEPQVQEVRYCLNSLREQMAARQNNKNNNKFPSNGHKVNDVTSKPHGTNGFVNGLFSKCQGKEDEDNILTLREVIKHLCTHLQEMEQRHQEENKILKPEKHEIQQSCLVKHNQRVHRAEKRAEEQSQNLEEMRKRVSSLELENIKLWDKLAASEAELEKQERKNTDRCVQLEKELKTMKIKNHNLDDMLKSIQKKIKNMIDRVQNSKTDIEHRDRMINDLNERISFLKAENRELHDRNEFYLGNQVPKPYDSDRRFKVVSSKPLIHTGPGNKSLPLMKVIETKS